MVRWQAALRCRPPRRPAGLPSRRPAATKQVFTGELMGVIDDIASRLDPTDAEAAQSDALTLFGLMLGTLQLPGNQGSALGQGAAWDPDTNLLYVPPVSNEAVQARHLAGTRAAHQGRRGGVHHRDLECPALLPVGEEQAYQA